MTYSGNFLIAPCTLQNLLNLCECLQGLTYGIVLWPFIKARQQHTVHCWSRCFWSNKEFLCWRIHPHLPNFALYDLFSFLKSRVYWKEHISSLDTVKKKVPERMKDISEYDLQHYFQQCKFHMEHIGIEKECVLNVIRCSILKMFKKMYFNSVQLFLAIPFTLI